MIKLKENIIEDYFTLEKKVCHLEQENKNLLNRIEKLEKAFHHIDKLKEKTRIQQIYHNSKKIYSVYQNGKVVLIAVCFLFGNKVITNPWILRTIYTILFQKKIK